MEGRGGGTEPAAATAVTGSRSLNTEGPLEFSVDRPFAFALADRVTATVLFIGYVTDPMS